MPPPDRWGDYSPVGTVIEGTRILCCKVPLKSTQVQSLPEEERFTPEELINKVSMMNCNLGLVVDLTFTRKYYNSQEFTDKGVAYEKIFTKGHDVPSDKVYGRFANILDTYIDDNKSNSSVIAVHCTHGVNRTGYLVCRYMIERHNMTPDDAIAAFNKARGHGLERENYLHDLQNRKPGVQTFYDPNEPMSDEDRGGQHRRRRQPPSNNRGMQQPGPSWGMQQDEPSWGIRLPKSRYEVENSYSRLKDMHRPEKFGEWLRQKERDTHFRGERSHSEMNSSWGQEGDDVYGGYGNEEYGEFQGGIGNDHGRNFDRGHGGHFERGQRRNFERGHEGHFERGHERNFERYHQGSQSWNQSRGRGQYGNFQPGRKEGLNQNFGHGSQDDSMYDGQGDEEYVSPMRFGDDSNERFPSRGGFHPNRGPRFNGNNGFSGREQDCNEFGGTRVSKRKVNDGFPSRGGFSGGYGHHDYTYEEVDNGGEYPSPMRYGDWSVENNNAKYAKSGWGSGARGGGHNRGRGRGGPYSQRPNRGRPEPNTQRPNRGRRW